MGFTLNTINNTKSALDTCVGMMVDNLSLFWKSVSRMTAKRRGGFVEYMQDALEGKVPVWYGSPYLAVQPLPVLYSATGIFTGHDRYV